jgi:DnaJ family protein B protein 4
MADNFYNTLGINENASKEEIKKAYRSLQMKYHPDKNPTNQQESINMTQKLNEAYETLGDEQKRGDYDMSRKNPHMKFNGFNPHGGQPPMDDIFNMFFGGMPGMGGIPGMQGFPGGNVHIFHGTPMGFQQALQKPTPIVKHLDINMEQVLNGANIPLEIERWILENGVKVFEKETFYVAIPQGIDEGELLIIRDKGNIINDIVKGDIKIFIKIINDTIFKRSGLDLILEKNITLKESLCGFSFEIKYINGKSYTLNNNKGSIITPDYNKIYPQMGLVRGEHKGNMIIHFHITFPETLSEEQIDKLIAIL